MSRVTHEEVYIERRAGSGQVSDSLDWRGRDYPRSRERGTGQRQPSRPCRRERSPLASVQVQETQQVTDTVRHEEARIEREGDANIEGDDTGVQDQ